LPVLPRFGQNARRKGTANGPEFDDFIIGDGRRSVSLAHGRMAAPRGKRGWRSSNATLFGGKGVKKQELNYKQGENDSPPE